jgi:hypothetical protein
LLNLVKQKQPGSGRLKKRYRTLKKALKKLRKSVEQQPVDDPCTYEEGAINLGGDKILEEENKTEPVGDETSENEEEVSEEEVSDLEIAFASVQQHEKIKKRKQQYCNDGDDIINDEDYYQDSLINDVSESDDISTPPPREKKAMKIQELQQQHTTLTNEIKSADLRGLIWRQLNDDCKFSKYFDSKWTMDKSNLSTLKFRVEDFIVYLHSKRNDIDNINVVHLLTDFLRNNVSLFNEYCLQLSEVQQLSPCTVRNYSDNLVKFLEWFALYRKKDTNKEMKQVRPGKFIFVNCICICILLLIHSALGAVFENGQANSKTSTQTDQSETIGQHHRGLDRTTRVAKRWSFGVTKRNSSRDGLGL